jgi:hypothetical protein
MKSMLVCSSLVAATAFASPFTSLRPSSADRCLTTALYTVPNEQSVNCVESCGVYGCAYFVEIIQPEGWAGYTCGCPGGGPWECCHLIAGYDPNGWAFAVPSGDCGTDGCPGPTPCSTWITIVSEDKAEFWADCGQQP